MPFFLPNASVRDVADSFPAVHAHTDKPLVLLGICESPSG